MVPVFCLVRLRSVPCDVCFTLARLSFGAAAFRVMYFSFFSFSMVPVFCLVRLCSV